MPTEDAYSSGHLVLSHFGTCMCSNVETNLSWACLVSGPLNFEHPSVLLFCLIHYLSICLFLVFGIGSLIRVQKQKCAYDPNGLLVTPTDRPKSVRNRCVIEVFGGVCVCCPLVFEFSVGVGSFVIGLSQISSFSSYAIRFKNGVSTLVHVSLWYYILNADGT